MNERETVELAGLPALGRLYARGAAGSVGAMVSPHAVRPGDLPAVQLVVRGVRADADHLTSYQQLLGEPATDVLPAGYLHVLAFPVATALMVRPDFPLPLVGLVHLANRVEQRRPVMLGEVLDVRVRAEHLRPHRKGTAVDLVAEVSAGDDVVWRGVSCYLARRVRLADDDGAADPGASGAADRAPGDATGSPLSGAAAERSRFSPPVPTGQWRLGADVGRRYAAVSGDHNPIHTSRVGARVFGFPRPIAHGMYTAARALADLGPAARGEAFVWQVEFARPVLLPSTVAIHIAPDAAAPAGHTAPPAPHTAAPPGPTGHTLTVWSPRTATLHLTGSVRPLA